MKEIENALGSEAARLLLPLGIDSLDLLVTKYRAEDAYKALARELSVPSRRVSGWLQRADVYRVRGIGPSYISLFEAAKICSAQDIAEQSAEQLHERLVRTNRQRRLVRRVPSVTMLDRSVEHATMLVRHG